MTGILLNKIAIITIITGSTEGFLIKFLRSDEELTKKTVKVHA